MRFLHQKFAAKKKQIVEVELDRPARVKFMTAREYKHYSQGRTHNYYGGRFEDSPVRFVFPFDSIWCVVVEKGTWHNPIPIKASCTLKEPDRMMLSSVATDAPDHVRQAALEDGEAEAISAGSRSEG